ncbi:MAG TPA: hypothetical protein VNV85_08310 [Puia sp.]|nr:hypothetical protein [Puia sp.]
MNKKLPDFFILSYIPEIQFVDDQNLYNGISNTHQFLYIIIPGAVLSTNSFTKDYRSLCQQLNIPEY